MRPIDADALKKEFDDKCAYECAICKYSKDFAPCKLIDNAPTVEQEYYITGAQWDEFMKEHRRTKGEWVYDNILNNWKCSECGETPKTIGYVGTMLFMEQHFKFCNHCGADMRKEAENE